ncbi:MAG: ATP-binding protein [Clostridia bacterium]|nr:ATP-binding protein [Clostridia bacterium]
MSVDQLVRDLDAVVVFRHVAEGPVLSVFRSIADAESPTRRYADFVSALFETHDDLSDYLLDALAEDENAYVQAVSRGDEIPASMAACVEAELAIFQRLSDLTFDDMAAYVHRLHPARASGYLPPFASAKRDLPAAYRDRIAKIRSTGYGMYAHHNMFRLEGKEIVPILSPDTRVLSDLIGYEREKEQLLQNTRALLEGKPAANTLLYGAAGTGKSSSVKAITNELAGEGLRLLELKKSQLHDIPLIMEELRNNPLKFIIFVDDLSFQKDDDNFATLKAILEGSASVKAPNTVIYATSNRRHLIRESFADREGDDIHRNDTIQETMSLSSRFGLTILFNKPSKADYLAIVWALAEAKGIEMDPDELDREASAFAIRKGGATPRAAEQFTNALLTR